MEIDKNVQKIKVRLEISTKASTDGLHIGGFKLGAELQEELKEIRAMQQKIITFMEYRHKWNNYMYG